MGDSQQPLVFCLIFINKYSYKQTIQSYEVNQRQSKTVNDTNVFLREESEEPYLLILYLSVFVGLFPCVSINNVIITICKCSLYSKHLSFFLDGMGKMTPKQSRYQSDLGKIKSFS